ncbi:MAG: hypothetical protein M3P26_05820, partial [Gemmatimonadota bacterium]|nr:hypothetical protein [Gemmatimonadota bacterium]
EQGWEVAIEIFKDRIAGRFLTPINLFLDYSWSGFAVLALDALLVETLQQFWEGQPNTPKGKGITYFKRLLCGPLFPPRARGFNPTTARLFYTTVRSSIVHQAQVTGSSRVRRDVPLVQLNVEKHAGPKRQLRARGITINPVTFHRAVEQAFDRYVALLRDPTQVERRANFRKKMDFIATERRDDVQG